MVFLASWSISPLIKPARIIISKEAVQDILYGFLCTQNKQQLAKDTKLSRSTIYNAVSTGNPSLETLLKIINKAS